MHRDMHAIDTGDRVRHRPTGDELLVIRVVGEQLYAAGRTPRRVDLSDCTLIKRATTAHTRLRLLQELAAGQSEHADWAREALQGLQVGLESGPLEDCHGAIAGDVGGPDHG